MTTRKRYVIDTLAARGIKTVGDLDKWRETDGREAAEFRGKASIPSRYSALVYLVGEDAAMSILNELAILRCTGLQCGDHAPGYTSPGMMIGGRQ